MTTDWSFLILRSARRFDWFYPIDLVIALDVPSTSDNSHVRNAFHVCMARLVKSGRLERTGERMSFMYRITQQGRLELDRLQRRAA